MKVDLLLIVLGIIALLSAYKGGKVYKEEMSKLPDSRTEKQKQIP